MHEDVQCIISKNENYLTKCTDEQLQEESHQKTQRWLEKRVENVLEKCNDLVRKLSMEKIKLNFMYILNLLKFLKC